MFEFFKRATEKEIRFGRTHEQIPYPVPSSQKIPSWYKEAPKFTNGDKPRVQSDIGESNLGLKYCIPFLDSMTAGYTVTLWQDLLVEQTSSGPSFTWPMAEPKILSGRSGDGLETFPTPVGHMGTQLIWQQPYSVQLPPGYSALYTHPLNRFDLPFITLSGIHDSDSLLPPGNFPFYLEEGFEGIIPYGTPIFQIIPFKREDWVGIGSKSVSDRSITRSLQSTLTVSGWYKKFKWAKKTYRMGPEE